MRKFSLIGNGLFVAGFVAGLYIFLNLVSQHISKIFGSGGLDMPLAYTMLVDCPKVVGTGETISVTLSFSNPLDVEQRYSIEARATQQSGVVLGIGEVLAGAHETVTTRLNVRGSTETSIRTWRIYGYSEAGHAESNLPFVGTCTTWVVGFAGLRGMSLVTVLSMFSVLSMMTGIIIGCRNGYDWLAGVQVMVMGSLLISLVLVFLI